MRRLQLWVDVEKRDGPWNMAVDEWLLETAAVPVLRVYRWCPGWGSFGYFVARTDAAKSLPDRRLVRRWTGGGIVDHENDWTYTLALPIGEPLASERSAGSYRTVHEAVADALRSEGVEARLCGNAPPARGGECFRQSVEHDVIGPGGEKLAGAGQRRTRRGLLHQGSVALGWNDQRPARLAGALALEIESAVPEPDPGLLKSLVERRYGAKEWKERC